MVTFVEKMADLLAAKLLSRSRLEDVEISRDEMSTVLETTHEGIFALDRGGYIKHCNNMAATLFKTTKADLIGTHINEFMLGTPALEVIETGRAIRKTKRFSRRTEVRCILL